MEKLTGVPDREVVGTGIRFTPNLLCRNTPARILRHKASIQEPSHR